MDGWAAARLGGGNEWGKQLPLGISQVGGVGAARRSHWRLPGRGRSGSRGIIRAFQTPSRWGAGRRVGVVAWEQADPVTGVGEDGQGAAVVPGDVDGGLGAVGDAGDGAAVSGPQAGVGVVGGDQLDAVAGGELHGGLPTAGRWLPAELVADGFGEV